MDAIKELIRLGNTDKALEQLRAVAGEKFEKEFIHLSSRYGNLMQEKIRGTLDPDDFSRELQKINAGILDLVASIEKPSSRVSPSHSGHHNYSAYALVALLVIALGLLAYFLKNSHKKTYYFNVAASGNAPSEITSVLDSLRTASENVRDISVNADYYWVVLLGCDRAMWSKDIPPFLDAKLREVYDQGRHTIRQVALGPHSRWVLLFDEKDYWIYPDVRDTLRGFLDADAWRRGEAVIQVTFGPRQDEFVVLAGGDFYAYSNIPADLLACLKNTSAVKSVSIGPEDEWVALSGRNDATAGPGIDEGLEKTLARLKKEKREIREVCLLKNKGWIVLTD